ncbi:MAG: LLM class F420-dependent oxidoreductase [Alphaproteobacteria bacterium]
MKIGVFSTFLSPVSTPETMVNFATKAEAAGIDSIWVGEHVVLFDEMEFPYPGSPDGKIPVPAGGGGLMDSVASFGFMAAHTKSIRFGTGICLIGQRNPIYTAKEFATLDYLTGGRMDFGVGIGWCKEEVIACGYTWEDRGARANEFLELTQKLWTEEVVHYSGEHFDVQGAKLDPKPVQKPHVPIIVGGHSKAGLERAARFGAGWYGFALTPENTADTLAVLDAVLAEAGRARGPDFEIVITPPGRVSEDDVKTYADLGVDRLAIQMPNHRPDKLDGMLEHANTLMNVAV